MTAEHTVERLDVTAVNARGARRFGKTPKIHPKRAQGFYRRLKWWVMAATLGVYYLLPWLRWDRGPGAPDQAVMIDLEHRRAYFFFIEIWPHEVYYLTGLLIMAAMGLFLMTSLFGRVWCGYTCPQTVWTDLMIAVERFVEGDRNARIKLDRAPWSLAKIRKRMTKHALWLLISLGTGGAFILYFGNAPDVLYDLVTGEAAKAAYLFTGLFTLTTYFLGGTAREKVCTYFCPWPRIQGAMLDDESLVVTYKAHRGEPRGSHKKGESWEGRGHCVDCNACVAVCPMGIDIRDGLQLECIGCSLCIDACDQTMDKVGLPRGLIDYSSVALDQQDAAGKPRRWRFLRVRPVLYAALWVTTGAVMLSMLLTRPAFDLNVQHDRQPLYVPLSDGSVRNGYTVKVMNMRREERTFLVDVEGQPAAVLSTTTPDAAVLEGGSLAVTVGPDRIGVLRAFVALPEDAIMSASMPMRFTVTHGGTEDIRSEETGFYAPQR